MKFWTAFQAPSSSGGLGMVTYNGIDYEVAIDQGDLSGDQTAVVHCVRHRDGWCACKINRDPGESAWMVETLCDHFIALPYASSTRQPTCVDCLGVLSSLQREK